MSKNKVFSIVTIICYCSVLFIPIAVVLMWFYTDWKKKKKLILSGITSLLYIILIVLLLNLKPAINTSGIGLKFGSSNSGYTAFENSTAGKKSKKEGEGAEPLEKDDFEKLMEEEEQRMNPDKSKNKAGNSMLIYPVLFFLFMLALIVLQNLRKGKKSGYENPYVDTNQYKLPLSDDAKMPMVHFLRLSLGEGEKILFATETNQKDKEGDFAVTNKRVVLFTPEGDVDFPLNALTAISSVTNSVLLLTSGERKYYIFMPETQMKYALAVVRWAYKKSVE